MFVYCYGAKTSSGSWDSVTCPHTLIESYCPKKRVVVPLVTENGASWTGALIIETTGVIKACNYGNAGSTDNRCGMACYPITKLVKQYSVSHITYSNSANIIDFNSWSSGAQISFNQTDKTCHQLVIDKNGIQYYKNNTIIWSKQHSVSREELWSGSAATATMNTNYSAYRYLLITLMGAKDQVHSIITQNAKARNLGIQDIPFATHNVTDGTLWVSFGAISQSFQKLTITNQVNMPISAYSFGVGESNIDTKIIRVAGLIKLQRQHSVSRVVVDGNVWMTIKFNGNIRFAYMIGAFDNGIAPGENIATITLPAAGYTWDGYGVNAQLLSNAGSSTPYFDNIAMITRSHTSSKFDLVAWNSSSTNISYRFCVVVTYYDQYSG